MSKKPNTLVTGDIIRKLRDANLSKRDEVRVAHLVVDEMKEALKRGEEVEWPFGSLKRVPQPRKPKRGWFLNKITTTYKRPFTVALVKAIDMKDLKTRRQKEEGRRGEAATP